MFFENQTPFEAISRRVFRPHLVDDFASLDGPDHAEKGKDELLGDGGVQVAYVQCSWLVVVFLPLERESKSDTIFPWLLERKWQLTVERVIPMELVSVDIVTAA